MSANATRVLVVDDEPEIVRGLKIVLRDAGYAVDAASTKAEALMALANRPPEALVLDLVLPDAGEPSLAEVLVALAAMRRRPDTKGSCPDGCVQAGSARRRDRACRTQSHA